ncbi:MAG: histidinol phosphate phosphatase [Clostridiales bacterium]|nr:histidinol phosphate phosphatase [Clostridiales bacterium]
MTDVHIHIEKGPYTKEWIDQFVQQAVSIGIDEIYLLEHSHRFAEFAPMYASICDYSDYQKNWYSKKGKLSIKDYQALITEMRSIEFPIKIKWGLEICYFPEYEKLIGDILHSFHFDFAVGSIHWVDGFGFDHKAEFWNGIDVEQIYRKYYDLMLRLVKSGLFSGVAHPDSIKCFHHYPANDLTAAYGLLADELNSHHMYAEQSGGLALNYRFEELGMNKNMLDVFKNKNVDIRFASDAHTPEHAGANISSMMQAFPQTQKDFANS